MPIKEQILYKQLMDKYDTYAATQAKFSFPKANIDICQEDNEKVLVDMNLEYKNILYRFESMKPEHQTLVYDYLNSNAAVRAKYASGNTQSLEDSNKRVNALSQRFNKTDANGESKQADLYSGFAVYDADTENFLGMTVLGHGEDEGSAELAYINRLDSWSVLPMSIVQEYQTSNYPFLNKKYTGVASAEAGTMLQYAKTLQTINSASDENALSKVTMTARVDNPGSWKVGAKFGMGITTIDAAEGMGKELRYQMCKQL